MAPTRDFRALQVLRLEELRPALADIGAGLLQAALFSFASLRFGGFALPAALALAAFGFPGRASAAGAALALLLLPFAGLGVCAAAGAALLAFGRGWKAEPADWPDTAAAGAWVCWAALADLLLADPLWGFCLPAAAAGLALTRFKDQAAAAAAGALGLALMRLVGLNAGEAVRLEQPAAGWTDLMSLGLPLLLACFLWLSASGARGRRGPAVAAGALAGAAAVHWLGAAPGALLFHGLQALLGTRALFSWLQLGPLALAGCFVLAWPARALTRDVWQNRLNAAFAGGRWLSFDGERGSYRFSSGAEVAVERGFAVNRTPQIGRRAAHLLALSHPGPRSALVLTDWPGAVEAFRLHADPAVHAGDPRRVVRACRDAYDVVLAAPPHWLRLRRLGTRGFLKELARCLKPGGVAGFLTTEELRAELAASASGVFPHTALAGPVLLMSGSPLSLRTAGAAALLDDPGLAGQELSASPPPSSARTDDRPFGPSVTSRNLYNLTR